MPLRIGAALAATLFCALAFAAPTYATFPGRNGKIAFASDRDQPNPLECAPTNPFACPPSDIYTVNPDGSGEIDLTHNPSDDTEPAWSSDGSRIAFATNRDGNYEIYTMNADGSGLARLTHDPATDRFPAWSPDGSKIVFVSIRSPGQPGIYVMSASDGSGATQVTSCSKLVGSVEWIDCERPRWSPDGADIAFDVSYLLTTCESCGISSDVDQIKPDGTGVTTIKHATVSDSFILPDWSPDSQRLVIENANFAPFYLINRDGSGIVNVGGSGFAPIWSPDGQRIAFVLSVVNPPGQEIATSNLDGSSPAIVTHDQARNLWPDWQPLPGPQRSDYKNAAQFCKAERDFLGDPAFTKQYGGGANAYGKCVSAK